MAWVWRLVRSMLVWLGRGLAMGLVRVWRDRLLLRVILGGWWSCWKHTVYGSDVRDIGNIGDYAGFVGAQRLIFEQVFRVVKPGGYLVVTNNVFAGGRLWPLAFDTLTSLSNLWVPKDERIWLHDDKRLLPLGVYNAWVANRCHHYCLIFRKESDMK